MNINNSCASHPLLNTTSILCHRKIEKLKIYQRQIHLTTYCDSSILTIARAASFSSFIVPSRWSMTYHCKGRAVLNGLIILEVTLKLSPGMPSKTKAVQITGVVIFTCANRLITLLKYLTLCLMEMKRQFLIKFLS